jgi:hypothetical protein
MQEKLTKRQRYELLRSQLETERTSFVSHWRDLADFLLPRRPHFNVTDVNKGDKKNQKIIDSTGTFAMRTLQSGMMGGITSPARPWFRLTTPDPKMAEFGAVKMWLDDVTKRMNTVFLRSNLYNTLHAAYGDLGCFGTAAIGMEEDFDNVIRFSLYPVGSYCIANGANGRVQVFQRAFRLTVRQVLEMFGKPTPDGYDWSNISTTVKNLWMNHQYDAWVDICHIIQPNMDYRPGSKAKGNKKFSSCYYERGSCSGSANYSGSDVEEKMLREAGFDYFPVLVPRWEVTGEDVYGTNCPGMVVLGDVKALQLMQKRAMQAIEKMINPPMVAHTDLRAAKTSLIPGDTTYVTDADVSAKFKPVHEVNPRMQEFLIFLQDHQERIKQGCFADLFLMMANSQRSNITAREIEERHEEKLLALGPVLEQLNQELLDPLIDNTFIMMERQGMLPPPPEELKGMDLKVEYISVMAQAQKLVSLGSLERFTTFVTNLAAQTENPAIFDKVDMDQLIDVHGDVLSVPPGIVRADDDVEKMRGARVAQERQAVEVEQGREQAAMAKDLGSIDTTKDNALTDLLRQAQAGQVAGVA